MQIESLRGFVLRTVPLSTSQRILTVFTESCGKRQGIFRVSKRNPLAYTSPMSLLQFHLRGKEHQQLPLLEDLSLERHFFNLAGDYLGLTLLHHWADLVNFSSADAHEEPYTFRLLNHCLSHLDKQRPNLFPMQDLYFQCWLLHFAGVLPRPKEGKSIQVPASSMSQPRDLEQTYSAMDHAILNRVFQQNLGDFTAVSLEYGVLAKSLELLEGMWLLFLGRPVKTHGLLQNQFKERGLL